jgi:dolichol-phosphate mannosyltransferase
MMRSKTGQGPKAAVVIPCYNVREHIADVISAVPRYIDYIIVVDDRCPQGSGKAAEKTGDPRVIVIYHEKNLGVGGAVVSGFRKGLALGCDILIKIDGDGQMAPDDAEKFIAPIQEGKADYVKGNRFRDFSSISAMPKIRLLGNSVLSFVVKLVSGYWNLVDPTNGYIAVSARTIEQIDLAQVARGYFFEIDMLVKLNIINAVIAEVPIPARYGDEPSSLSVARLTVTFPAKLLGGLMKRILFKYYIYDFNMASVYLLIGVPLFIFGVGFGFEQWIDSYLTQVPRSPGTIMLVALPIIVSLEMLLQAINIDINSVPKR